MAASGKLCCTAAWLSQSRPGCRGELRCTCIGLLCPQSRHWKPIFWCTRSERQLRPHSRQWKPIFWCTCSERQLCPQSSHWKPVLWCTCSERPLRPQSCHWTLSFGAGAANDSFEPKAGLGSLLILEVRSNLFSGCLINSNPSVIYETF